MKIKTCRTCQYLVKYIDIYPEIEPKRFPFNQNEREFLGNVRFSYKCECEKKVWGEEIDRLDRNDVNSLIDKDRDECENYEEYHEN